jgi:hypothetical protein
MLRDIAFPEAGSGKYLGIILDRDINLADQINYSVAKLKGATLYNA